MFERFSGFSRIISNFALWSRLSSSFFVVVVVVVVYFFLNGR